MNYGTDNRPTFIHHTKVEQWSPVSIQTQRTQRMQRKRLRLDRNRAWDSKRQIDRMNTQNDYNSIKLTKPTK